MKQTTPLYDAHIHLSDTHYSPHMEYIIYGMEQTNLAACCMSTNIRDSEATVRLARLSARLLPFVGIHPQFADVNMTCRIEEMISERVPAGIGEIGLDPTYDTDMETQQAVFVSQLYMAEKANLPVSIHSRKSLGAILDILPSYSCRALLHWFDGNKASLRRAMDMGLYVSYGPLAVYASDKRRLLSLTHTDRILVETDGPVSFAGCFSGMPAQLGFLPSVAFTAANMLQYSYSDMVEQLYSNVKSYLGTVVSL